MSSKIEYRTAYDYEKKELKGKTPSGRPYKDEYGYEIDKYGRKILVKTGETNLYEIIQESLEETKIENILKRVAIGDNSMMRPDGIYADLTEMPSNLIEARQAMQKLENLWGELPKEIKQKYNYNVEEFIGAAGKETWLKDMGLLPTTEEKTIITETKTKEEGEA